MELGGNIPEFISKLYTLLQNPSNTSIVTWSSDGESFLILDINEFSRSILPKHFKHSNFSSFVRQLNKYDFHKVKNNSQSSSTSSNLGEDRSTQQAWEFYHPNFQRDRLELLPNIRRKKTLDPNNSSALSTGPNSAIGSGAGAGHSTPISGGFPPLRPNPSPRGDWMEELYEMHDQVGAIAKMQNDMALALQVISKNYQALIDEYCMLRRQVVEQDKILRYLLAGVKERDKNRALLEHEVESQLGRMAMVSGIGNNPNNPNDSASPPSQVAPKTVQEGGGGAGGLHWRESPRILLVEDDVICRKLSSKMLEIFGCVIDISSDGNDAVAKLSGPRRRYNLVLMDIVMPNMDGLSATKRIREFDRETPIIAMTSNVSSEDCAVYMATGMNDILGKPFSKEAIMGLLGKYCKHLQIGNVSEDAKGQVV